MQLKYFLTFFAHSTHSFCNRNWTLFSFITLHACCFQNFQSNKTHNKTRSLSPTKTIPKLYIQNSATCTPLNPIPITYYYYVPSSNPLKYEVVQRISFTVFTFLQLPKKVAAVHIQYAWEHFLHRKNPSMYLGLCCTWKCYVILHHHIIVCVSLSWSVENVDD